MDFQKLTIKAQEAFASAQGDAIARGNPELTPEHLLAALVDQDGGVAPRILEKAGESPTALRARLEEQPSRVPPMGGPKPPPAAPRPPAAQPLAAGRSGGGVRRGRGPEGRVRGRRAPAAGAVGGWWPRPLGAA